MSIVVSSICQMLRSEHLSREQVGCVLDCLNSSLDRVNWLPPAERMELGFAIATAADIANPHPAPPVDPDAKSKAERIAERLDAEEARWMSLMPV